MGYGSVDPATAVFSFLNGDRTRSLREVANGRYSNHRLQCANVPIVHVECSHFVCESKNKAQGSTGRSHD